MCFAGMAFLVATFAVFLVKERVTKSKHIQFVSGVSVFNYWASTFTWDLCNFIVPCILLVVVMAAVNIEGYVEDNNLL